MIASPSFARCAWMFALPGNKWMDGGNTGSQRLITQCVSCLLICDPQPEALKPLERSEGNSTHFLLHISMYKRELLMDKFQLYSTFLNLVLLNIADVTDWSENHGNPAPPISGLQCCNSPFQYKLGPVGTLSNVVPKTNAAYQTKEVSRVEPWCSGNYLTCMKTSFKANRDNKSIKCGTEGI